MQQPKWEIWDSINYIYDMKKLKHFNSFKINESREIDIEDCTDDAILGALFISNFYVWMKNNHPDWILTTDEDYLEEIRNNDDMKDKMHYFKINKVSLTFGRASISYHSNLTDNFDFDFFLTIQPFMSDNSAQFNVTLRIHPLNLGISRRYVSYDHIVFNRPSILNIKKSSSKLTQFNFNKLFKYYDRGQELCFKPKCFELFYKYISEGLVEHVSVILFNKKTASLFDSEILPSLIQNKEFAELLINSLRPTTQVLNMLKNDSPNFYSLYMDKTKNYDD